LGSYLGIIGNEYGGFGGQGHDGILELVFCGLRAMHLGGEKQVLLSRLVRSTEIVPSGLTCLIILS
jgi:hypothetical protein